jgi:hypothetical protein
MYHIPEDSNLHSYHCENIKYLISHITAEMRSFKIISDVLFWQDDPGACSGNKSPALNMLLTWTAGIQFAAGAEVVLYSAASRLAWGPTQPPVIFTRGLSKGVKCLWCEADRSPSSAEVKNGGAILPLSHTSSWHGS